jgi:hypothetical protein
VTSPEVPANLPIAQEEVVIEDEIDALKALETHAHVHATLISSDALRLIASHGTRAEQMAILDKVIAAAKTKYPSENDWIVLNKERVMTLLA